jgi:hypothetical protein
MSAESNLSSDFTVEDSFYQTAREHEEASEVELALFYLAGMKTEKAFELLTRFFLWDVPVEELVNDSSEYDAIVARASVECIHLFAMSEEPKDIERVKKVLIRGLLENNHHSRQHCATSLADELFVGADTLEAAQQFLKDAQKEKRQELIEVATYLVESVTNNLRLLESDPDAMQVKLAKQNKDLDLLVNDIVESMRQSDNDVMEN